MPGDFIQLGYMKTISICLAILVTRIRLWWVIFWLRNHVNIALYSRKYKISTLVEIYNFSRALLFVPKMVTLDNKLVSLQREWGIRNQVGISQ